MCEYGPISIDQTAKQDRIKMQKTIAARFAIETANAKTKILTDWICKAAILI
jgi:hypothetical protein